MKVKTFYKLLATTLDRESIETEINDFLKEIPKADIVQINTLAFPSWGSGVPDAIAVFVWLRADAFLPPGDWADAAEEKKE